MEKNELKRKKIAVFITNKQQKRKAKYYRDEKRQNAFMSHRIL